jgi:hypothetical protein
MSGRTHLIDVTLEIGDDLRSPLLLLLVENTGNRNRGRIWVRLDIECLKWETRETRDRVDKSVTLTLNERQSAPD